MPIQPAPELENRSTARFEHRPTQRSNRSLRFLLRLSRLCALLCGATAGTAAADWLVIDSDSTRFPRYLLLDHNARVELAPGERLQLLDDAGATHALRGPGTTRLADLQVGGTPAATDGLLDRIATLLAAPGQAQVPGTSRSLAAEGHPLPGANRLAGGWPTAPPIRAANTLRVDASGPRCLTPLDGLVLERAADAARHPARVEIRLPGNPTVHSLAWRATATTLDLGRVVAPATTAGDVGIRIVPTNGAPRQLTIRLVPDRTPLVQRLDQMSDAGCRDDLARLLETRTKP